MLISLTIFLSAFLLFQLQPVIARYILPWYGGHSGVWTTCMLFFQVGLLLGYTYAHLLVRILKVKYQIIVHAAILVLSLLVLPVIPSESLKPMGNVDPTWDILRLLLLTAGAPFLMVSATGPLVQHWYSQSHPRKSPYRLYALSNFGSLLALLTYPFLIEPLLGLDQQAKIWSFGYVVFAVLCMWCGQALTSRTQSPSHRTENSDRPWKNSIAWVWVGLSACGSILLLAVTSKITEDFSAIPLLWVLPLSLYLITFIIAFDNPRWYRRAVWVPVFLMATVLMVYLLQHWADLNLVTAVLLFNGALFCIVMVCHGELVRHKPAPHKLTIFYLMVALGGALGGVFVSIVAVRVFSAFWELHVGLLAAFLLVGYSLFNLQEKPRPSWHSPAQKIWVLGSLLLGGFLIQGAIESEGNALVTRRNFHSVLRVHEMDIGKLSHRRVLYSGQINHGLQLLHPDNQGHIGSYYSSQSGFGLAIQQHPKRLARSGASQSESQADSLRVGVLGLGVGVIASWGLPQDNFRFYEINPAVVTIADDYFSLLRNARCQVEIIEGDGRISLERELSEDGPQNFDILVIDAFSGDAIPVHLLTIEAFRLYLKHLNFDGILAFNITNRHLELEPVIASVSQELGLPALIIIQEKRSEDFINRSKWALLTRNEQFLQNPRILEYSAPCGTTSKQVGFWSDNYSSLFQLLK